jgi:hypothetical protein
VTAVDRDALVAYLARKPRGELWRAMHHLSLRLTEPLHPTPDGHWWATARLGVRHRFEETFRGDTAEEVLAKVVAHGLSAVLLARESLLAELKFTLPELGLSLENTSCREVVVLPPPTVVGA